MSAKKKSNSYGRADLVERLKNKRGLSRRKSVVVVNTILDRMIYHLRRGHRVEFPYGTLKRVRRYFGQRWAIDNDWPANRDPYTIEWELNEAGTRKLNNGRPG
jgi:hypothetical protein